MIEPLDWDSQFFGYPVGRITLEDSAVSSFNLNALYPQLSAFRVVYIFSPQELSETNNEKLFLADKKVLFFKKLNQDIRHELKADVKEYRGELTGKLLNLVLESGIHSRFRVDKHFKNKEFERLYTEWIIKSLDGSLAEKVFVAFADNQIAGFITVGRKNKRTDIGLIAVDEKFRGRSIASSLIAAACNYSINIGVYEIQVVTQGDNNPAMQLYTRNGFNVEQLTYIYHYWNE